MITSMRTKFISTLKNRYGRNILLKNKGLILRGRLYAFLFFYPVYWCIITYKEVFILALTVMKKRFADYYIETLKVSESMKRAGYKGNQKHLTTKGTDMLREDLEVKEYVRKRMEQKDNDIVASQNDVLKYLSDCVKGTAIEKTYFTLKRGNKGHFEDELVCRNVPVKAKDRIKACEIMAKYLKLFGDNEDKQRPIIINNTIPRPEKKES